LIISMVVVAVVAAVALAVLRLVVVELAVRIVVPGLARLREGTEQTETEQPGDEGEEVTRSALIA
jgi:hypothetical protein